MVFSALRSRRRSSSASRDAGSGGLFDGLRRREASDGSHDDEGHRFSFARSRNGSRTSLPPSSFRSRTSGTGSFFDGLFRRDRERDKDKGVAALLHAAGAAAAVGSDEAAEAGARPVARKGSFDHLGHLLALGDGPGEGEGESTRPRLAQDRLAPDRTDSIAATPFVGDTPRRFSLPGDGVPLRSIALGVGLESDPADTAVAVKRDPRFDARRRSSWTSQFPSIPDPAAPNPAAARHAHLHTLLPATWRWVAAAPGAHGKAHRLRLALEALREGEADDDELHYAPMRGTGRVRGFPEWQTTVLFHAEVGRCDQCFEWYEDAAGAEESDGTDDDEHAAWVRRLKAAGEDGACAFRATEAALARDRDALMAAWAAARGEKGRRRPVPREQMNAALRWLKRYHALVLASGRAPGYDAVLRLYPDEGGGEEPPPAEEAPALSFPTPRPYRSPRRPSAGATATRAWRVHNPDAPAPSILSDISDDEVRSAVYVRPARAELRRLARAPTAPAAPAPPPPPQLPASVAASEPEPGPRRTASPDELSAHSPASPRPRLSVELPRPPLPPVHLIPATPQTPGEGVVPAITSGGLRPPPPKPTRALPPPPPATSPSPPVRADTTPPPTPPTLPPAPPPPPPPPPTPPAPSPKPRPASQPPPRRSPEPYPPHPAATHIDAQQPLPWGTYAAGPAWSGGGQRAPAADWRHLPMPEAFAPSAYHQPAAPWAHRRVPSAGWLPASAWDDEPPAAPAPPAPPAPRTYALARRPLTPHPTVPPNPPPPAPVRRSARVRRAAAPHDDGDDSASDDDDEYPSASVAPRPYLVRRSSSGSQAQPRRPLSRALNPPAPPPPPPPPPQPQPPPPPAYVRRSDWRGRTAHRDDWGDPYADPYGYRSSWA
ncbi:hypothetical protein Q8F55_009173 [Vanrija albida]|uniref:Uncharacterized protein n=1 Tax=Vanrija albida TaxID=181172 RepID=A0ABR3PSW1_9TREE